MALYGRSYTYPIIRQGDPNAGNESPAPLIVSAQPQLPPRSTIVLASASADIYEGGVTVVSPFTAPAVVPAPIITAAPAPVATTVQSSPQPIVSVPGRASVGTPEPIISVAPAVVVASSATPSPTIVQAPRSGASQYCVLLSRNALVSSGIPKPLLPLSLLLDTHTTGLTLNVHSGDLSLDPHQTNLSLDD